MDNTANVHQEGLRSTIQPYYMRGDVFQRDQRYYDQTLQSRRLRSGNKRYYESRNRSRDMNDRNRIEVPQRNQPFEDEETRRLRQQNTRLMTQLQKMTYGGQFGTGDEVVKRQYYTGTHEENERIRNQQGEIRRLQGVVKYNNERLTKYQRAVNQLQVRMSNIQSIDREIYRQLKGASLRDQELLERAKNALLTGERQEAVRILEQIIVT